MPKKCQMTGREILREVMEPYDPGSTYARWSLVADLFILVCILASCALVVLEHLYPSDQHPELSALFWDLEVGFTVIFVIEYLLRWYSSERPWRYPFGFYAIIDLTAILPTILMAGAEMLMLRVVRGVRLLRLLRLLRLVRLFKAVRYGYLIYHGLVGLRTWALSVNYQYRLRELGKLFVWVVIAWLVGANVLYLTETRLVGFDGPFGSYFRSYWNIVIVLISGIEDKEPISLLGRIEITVLLIFGICVVGMLTGEIVAVLVRKTQRAGKVAIKPPGGQLAEHVLILGQNSHLDNVIRQVHAATDGQHYILVVCPGAEELSVSDPKVYRKVFALAADPIKLPVLQEACASEAVRVIILACEDHDQPAHLVDDRTLMEMVAVVCHKNQVPMVVELRDEQSERDALAMTDSGVEFLLSRPFGEGLISQAVLNPGVTEIYTHLMTFTTDSNEFYTMTAPAHLVGKHFTEAQLELLDYEGDDIVLVGIDRSPPNRPNTVFWLNPLAGDSGCADEDLVLREGDNIIVVAFERPSFAEVDQEDLWSGKVLTRG